MLSENVLPSVRLLQVSFYSQATNVIEQYDDEVQSMVKEVRVV